MVKVKKAPRVSNTTALRLWVAAGGRCSFPGCNKYLLRDSLTMREIKNGHVAHVVGRSREQRSPRGQHWLPIAQRSNFENLMLVCQEHHTHIDEGKYRLLFTTEYLLKHKRLHEQRVFDLTNLGPERRTKVIRLRAVIDGEQVNASQAELFEALFECERYPSDPDGIEIDLTQHPVGDTPAFIQAGVEQIDAQLQAFFRRGILGDDVQHVSIFAIGSIPLLVHLGSRLSNKIPTDLYQRHRNPETWCWPEGERTVTYEKRLIQAGTDLSQVALVLSLSGRITREQLPEEIDERFFIYEITLQDIRPNPMFLTTRQTLADFQYIYQQFLAKVRDEHATAEMIHLFPAVPAPVAVTCGRELLHKIAPGLLVYDNNKKRGGFELVLEVN